MNCVFCRCEKCSVYKSEYKDKSKMPYSAFCPDCGASGPYQDSKENAELVWLFAAASIRKHSVSHLKRVLREVEKIK